MHCPKCGSEQPEQAVECGKCGVIMAKAARPAPRPAPAELKKPEPAAVMSAPPDEPSAPKPAPLIRVALLLLAVVALGWWLNYPQAGDILDGAYVNVKHQFALNAPPEWLQITPENYRQIMAEYNDRFPRELSALIANPGFEVSFVRIPATVEEFAPSFNVVVMPMKQNLPPLTESQKDEAAQAITKEMKKSLKDYALEASSIVEVDGLASLKLTGTAPLTVVLEPSRAIMSEKGAFGLQHVVGHTQEINRTFTLKADQILVPGRKRGYVVSSTAEEGKFSDVAPVFDSVTASFRVLERPPRLGPILMGSLNGGLIGAGLYLLYIIAGRIIVAVSTRP